VVANAGPYVFLPFLFHYLLEFLVIVFEVDAIVSSCLNRFVHLLC
jgi:hypothetical protein